MRSKTKTSIRPARARSLRFLLALSMLLGLVGVTALPAQEARAEENPPSTSIRQAQDFYAYVEAGENLDVVFTKSIQLADVAGVTITVEGPGGVGQTCGVSDGDPVGEVCEWIDLTSTESGVWHIDFSPNTGSTGDNFVWAISVQDGTTDQPGRVWADKYVMSQGSSVEDATDFTFYYKNREGFLYQADYTNYHGIESTFSSDAAGVTEVVGGEATCTSAYRSIESGEPGYAMPGDCGDPYKIFFEPPADDLPATATQWDGSEEWINPDLVLPDVTGLDFEQDGPGTLAGTFSVETTNFTGQMVVQIDANNDGDYGDPQDVSLPVGITDGAATVNWNGRDGQGNPISPDAELNARALIDQAGEIHFVQGDVELRGGIEVTALNGPSEDSKTIYWDDTQVPAANKVCQTPELDGTGGVDSSGGVHGWDCFANSTTPGEGSWGNQAYLDDWTYHAVEEELAITLPAVEQEPFVCEPNGFLFQNPTGEPPVNVIDVDLASGATSDPMNIDDWVINAVGYNIADNYIYGYGTNTTDPDNPMAGLVRVGSDGSVYYLGVPTGDGADTFGAVIGDVDDNNHYWMFNTGTNEFWNVDLATMEIEQYGVVPPPAGSATGGQDWAFLPGSDTLWRVPSNPDQTTSYLLGFNRTSLEWTTPISLGSMSDNLNGAVFADPAGNLYVSFNATGEIWRIDTDTNTAAPLTLEGPTSGGNDAARCATAPVPIDFGDAPDSYSTILNDNGPRHSVPNFDTANNTAPLMLGESIDLDGDGVPSGAADGDDTAGVADEDGTSSPIEVAPTDATVTVSATNNTGQPATLAGWLDVNGGGTFEASERVLVEVPANTGTADYALAFPDVTATSGVYARFRLFPGAVEDPAPTGTAAAGEVEDYPVEVRALEIDKTSNATPNTRIGDTVEYTVTITNIGGSDYTEDEPAEVHDSLAGVLDDATYNGDATASAGTVSFEEPRLSWSGALAGGASVTITYSVTLTGDGDGEVSNVAFECPTDAPDCEPPPECVDGVDPETGLQCDSVEFGFPKLAIEKEASTDALPAVGDTVTYTVTATNTGTAAYTEDRPAPVVDDMSDVLDDVTLDEASIAADTGAAPTFDDPRINWSGPLAVGETVTITYDVTYTGEGNNRLVNIAFGPQCPADDPQCDTPTPECNPADENGNDEETGLPCGRVSVPGAWLDVDKSVDPDDGSTVTAGQVLTYTLTFDSTGETAADVRNWTDYVSGIIDDGEIIEGPTASNEALTVSEVNEGAFTINGSVPAGEAYTVTYTVRVLPDGERGDNLLGNFLVPDGGDPQEECAEGDPLCTQNPIPEIVDDKSVAPEDGSTVQPGQELTYTLTYTNEGAGAGMVDRVDDLTHLLDDATITSDPVASDPALTVSAIENNRYAITGELAAGQTVTITYTATVNAADEMGDAVLANFLMDPEDPPTEEPACEEGDEDCTENPAGKVIDSKSVDPEDGSTVTPGQELTYTLTFTNEGKGVGSVDEVDDLTHVLDDATITGEPVASDEALSVSAIENNRYSITGELEPGETVTVSYTVEINSNDDLGDAKVANFLLPPGSDTPVDPGDCAADDPDCTYNPSSKMVDGKSVDPESGASVTPGQQLTYTLTFSNTGAGAGAVERVDDLTHVLDDAEVTEAPQASSESLTVSGIENNRFSITGELQPGETVTVSYTVTVNGAADLGDSQLANFILGPDDPAPEEPVCQDGEDCTYNPVSDITVAKSSDPETGTELEEGQQVTYELTFTNNGAAAGAVDYTDHMAGVLDDADLVSGPESSDPALSASSEGDQLVITGELAAGQTVTVSYQVEVKEYAAQGDHELGNFVTVTGQEPPAECAPDSSLCTVHAAAEGDDDGGLGDTGSPAVLAPIVALGLLLIGGGGAFLVRGLRRRRAGLHLTGGGQ